MRDIALQELQKTTINDAAPLNNNEKINLGRNLARLITTLSNINISTISRNLAEEMVRRANVNNRERVSSAFQNALGVDINNLLTDSNIREQLELAIENNVNLIQSIHTDFISEIGDVVRSNLFDGGRPESIRSLIFERSNVTKSRAEFIARDQTSKLNGSLSRLRAESIGLDLYYWQGADDERERESHRVLNGMLCKYSDSTVYSDDDGKTWKKRSAIGGYIGNPGDDYQCRCTSIPYVKLD